MPTGYTADVADGKVTDFRTFALRCARQFGATIMQRDNPMDEPPKLREESPYYVESVERDEARVAFLDALTAEEAEREAAKEFDRAMASHRKYEGERTETRNRYNAMLAEVVQWTPPTPEHQGLKDFMLQQLHESIKFDCGPLWGAPERMSGAEWLAAEKERAARSLARSRESLREERERVKGANEWIAALYDALPETVPA
jgi:hypothetical protein